MPTKRLPLKVKIGRGVLCKDGKTPWAPSTIHATWTSERGQWKSPKNYSMASLCELLRDMGRGEVDEIQVIDHQNRQFIISLDQNIRVKPKVEA